MSKFSFDAIHMAVMSALGHDLPDVEYGSVDGIKYRRPALYEIEVIMFPQKWKSSSLGYGGLESKNLTVAYTIIVGYYTTYCVYFGCGKLAYKIDINKISSEGREAWLRDIHAFEMVNVDEALRRYT